MYNIIQQIIDHSWGSNDGSQQYIYFICGALIIVGFTVFIDLLYRVLYSIVNFSKRG